MSNPTVLQKLEESRVLFRSYVAKPEPRDLFDKQQWNMAGVHLMLIESMLSVYKHAEGIKPADEQAFGFYALIAMGGIHHHHRTEEDVYLPMLEPEFKAPIQAEHDAFTGVLHDLEDYLQDLNGLELDPTGARYLPMKNPKPKPAYDGKRIAKAIEEVVEPMTAHLAKEIEYLDGDKLRACGLPLSKLQAWAQYEKDMIKNLDPWVALVFVCGHTPSNSRFPSLPPGMRSIFVPYIFARKHNNAWRFLPPQEPLPTPQSTSLFARLMGMFSK